MKWLYENYQLVTHEMHALTYLAKAIVYGHT